MNSLLPITPRIQWVEAILVLAGQERWNGRWGADSNIGWKLEQGSTHDLNGTVHVYIKPGYSPQAEALYWGVEAALSEHFDVVGDPVLAKLTVSRATTVKMTDWRWRWESARARVEQMQTILAENHRDMLTLKQRLEKLEKAEQQRLEKLEKAEQQRDNVLAENRALKTERDTWNREKVELIPTLTGKNSALVGTMREVLPLLRFYADERIYQTGWPVSVLRDGGAQARLALKKLEEAIDGNK